MRGPGTFLTHALPSSTVVEGCHLPCTTILEFRNVSVVQLSISDV